MVRHLRLFAREQLATLAVADVTRGSDALIATWQHAAKVASCLFAATRGDLTEVRHLEASNCKLATGPSSQDSSFEVASSKG